MKLYPKIIYKILLLLLCILYIFMIIRISSWVVIGIFARDCSIDYSVPTPYILLSHLINILVTQKGKVYLVVSRES
jgi:hypothetical protein